MVVSIREWLNYIQLAWVHIFLLSFGISYVVTPIIRAIALKLKILDMPGEGKIHKRPIPLLGGVSIYIAFATTVLFNFRFSDPLKGVAIGATLMLIMGLIDDLRGLPARLRLLVQIAATLILIRYGVILTFLPNNWLGYTGEVILTILWIIGITNAFNFFDGMDGLAAGLGSISALSFFIIARQTNQPYLGYLTLALAASCLGFLRYNFKPATIFLGDAGSTFIGFSLAALAIMGGWAERNAIVALSVPLLVLGVFIFDMVYITLARIRSGRIRNFREWLEYTGQDHLHHRLVALGLTERQTVLFIYLIAVCLGIAAITLNRAQPGQVLLELTQGLLILIIIAVLMIVGRKTK